MPQRPIATGSSSSSSSGSSRSRNSQQQYRSSSDNSNNKRKPGQTSVSTYFSKRQQHSHPSEPSKTPPSNNSFRITQRHHRSPDSAKTQVAASNSPSALSTMAAFPGSDLNIGTNSNKGPLASPNARNSQNNKIPLKNNVRKLVIKNSTTNSTDNAEKKNSEDQAKKYYDLTMSKLQSSIQSILNEIPTEYSLEDLYRGVENLCRYDKSSALWTMCYDTLRSYMKSRQLELTAKASECEPEMDGHNNNNNGVSPLSEDFLRIIYKEWNQWSMKTTLIRNIFFYLDRSYLFPSATRKPIWETSVDIFSSYILRDENISRPLHSGIISLLTKKRAAGIDGVVDTADMSLLDDIFRVYSSNKSDLEKARNIVVSSASKFCRTNLKDPNDIELFLKTMARRVATELEVAHYLDFPESTQNKLMESIRWESINYTNRHILFDKIGDLVKSGQMDLILVLYTASLTVGGYQDLSKSWGDYIYKRGIDLTKNEQTHSSKQFIPDLIDHYRLNFKVLNEGFENHDNFNYSFRSSIQEFVNHDQNSSMIAEKLAKYSDDLMRSGTTKLNLSQTELDEQMNYIIDIYSYVHGKDVFDSYYKKDLARRLLLGRSENLEMEQVMISKFKAETGSVAVQQLETMYNDMTLSKDEISKFNNNNPSTNNKKSKKLGFNVSVLTQGVWPTYPDLYMKLPDELNKLSMEFEKFYINERKGRKLKWHHGLGNCIVKARFPNGVKELYVSELQAAIILLFNDNTELSYKSIQDELAIEGESAQGTLTRALQSLACGKTKVLTKSDNNNDIDMETDTFKINEDFNEKSVRIKINQIQPKKRIEEQRNEVQKEIERDRHMEVQAAIIRIMKTRKELEHHQLIEEVITLTKDRGCLQVPEIKKNIDLLLEKEFLDRREENTYVYI